MHTRNFPILGVLAISAILSVLHSPAAAQTTPGHWVLSFSLSRPNAAANSIGFIDSAYGIAFIDSGALATRVYRTTDGGNSWSLWGSTDSGFHMFGGGTHPLQMFSKRDVYYAGTSSDYWTSSDSGKTFEIDLCPWNPTTVAATMFTPEFGRCITGYQNPSLQVYETRDSGVSFQPRSSIASSNAIDDAVFFDSSFWLVALHEKTILRTRDGGLTWDTVLNTPQISFYNEVVASTDRSHVYVTGGLYNGKGYSASFFESTDTGNSWRADSSIYGNRIARMASPAPGKIWALVRTGLQSAADSLFYSSDDGATWAKDSVTFIGKSLLDIVWPDSTHGYLWGQSEDTVYVYRFVNDLAGVTEPMTSMATLASYSNPFPQSTTITLTTPASGVAELSVVNVLGEEVAHLYNGELGAGEHSFTFNASGLASGTYWCVMRSNGLTQELPMILSR